MDELERALAQTREALSAAEQRLHLTGGRTLPWTFDLAAASPDWRAAFGAWWTGLFPDDRARFEALVREALQGDGRLDVEFQVVQGARALWLRCHGAILRDAEGRPSRMIGITQDVTGQRRAAEALRDSEERFRALFHQSGAGVAQLGLDGRWLTVNERFAEILGRSREELHGMTSQELTHPDDVEPCAAHYRRLRAGDPVPHCFEKRYLRPGGGVAWVNLTVSLVRDAERQPNYFFVIAEDVSARKAAEDRLRGSRERLLLAHRIAGVACWEWDPQARYRDVPPEFFELFDIDPADPDPVHSWMIGVHPEDRPALQNAIQHSSRGGQGEAEYRYLRPPLRTRWFSAVIQRSPGGRLLAVSLEITRLKEHESALRESEEQFRTLADAIPQLAWIADASGWVFWFNRRWRDYTGGAEEEMAGWGWKKAIAPEHAERVMASWRQALEGGEGWEDSFPLRTKTGEDRWFLCRATPIRNNEGSIVRWFGANTDITDRRDSERLLRESDARFRRLCEASVAGVFSADLEKVYDANGVFLRMLGYAREELDRGGLPWRRITPSGDAPLDDRAIEELAAHGECAPLEKEFLRKDGTRARVLLGAALLERSPLRWLCFCLDLSERNSAAKPPEAAP